MIKHNNATDIRARVGAGAPFAMGDAAIIFSEGPKCGNCEIREKQENKKYKVCSGCSNIYYCSRKCQKMHWKVHKKICKEKS